MKKNIIDKLEEKLKFGEEMTEDERREFKELILEYIEIIEYDEKKKANIKKYEHGIEIKEGIEPIKQVQYKETDEKKKIVRNEVEEMLKQNVIRKSKSPWSSPVTLVKKKGGEWRFCIDFRKVNSVTKKDSYPIPRIDEMLDRYRESSWFTSIDLAAGYWQVPMKEEDKEKTAFVCSRGFYEFNVMPFGLTNAPATFQRMMDEVLQEERDEEFVIVYLDDIMINSKNFEEHLVHVRRVLEKLRNTGMIIKLKKCEWGKRNIEYLGHIVGKDGLKPNEKNITAIKNMKRPTNKKEIQSFHGLCNYYRKFVKNFSKIMKPINQLVKKNVKFEWKEEQEKAFQEMKKKLIEYPILVQPDFTKEFVLITDASIEGLGAILTQKNEEGKEVVIAYASKTLNQAEKNYCITEQEMLAIVWGIEHFRRYLYGRKFIVMTDHLGCKILRKANDAKGKRARWEAKLMQYDFEIIYRPGEKNKNADALSRLVQNEQ